MKKFYVNQLLVLTFFAVLGFSCSKDDDEVKVDLRDQAIGSYDISGEVVTGVGNYSVDGVLVVSKHASDQNRMILSFEGGTFYAEKIAEASNGITFDIPTQEFTDSEGDKYFLKGSKKVTLGSSKYDGAYFSGDKEIKIGIVTEYEDEQWSDFNEDVILTGTRN